MTSPNYCLTVKNISEWRRKSYVLVRWALRQIRRLQESQNSRHKNKALIRKSKFRSSLVSPRKKTGLVPETVDQARLILFAELRRTAQHSLLMGSIMAGYQSPRCFSPCHWRYKIASDLDKILRYYHSHSMKFKWFKLFLKYISLAENRNTGSLLPVLFSVHAKLALQASQTCTH